MLKNDEGFRDKPYRDTVGKLTIGYGHNLDDKGLSKAASEFILQEDITDAIHLAKTFPWFDVLSPVRQDVIVMMTFNMGDKVLQFAKMVQAIKNGDWYQASQEMLASHWAKQVKDRALVLSRMMFTDKYPDEHINDKGAGT